MLNLFLRQSALGAMVMPDAADRAAPYRDAVIELIDLPLTGICRVEKEYIDITIYYRDERASRSREYRRGRIPIGSGLSPQEDQVLFLFALALKLSCSYLQERGMLDAAVARDEKAGGICIDLQEERLYVQPLEGAARPDLACTTLDGTVEFCRPYADEQPSLSGKGISALQAKIEQARAGDEEMMEQLAIAYLDGDGVEADAEQAAYWFRQLAQRGNAVAQFNLALHYAKGFGVPRDLEQALYWMNRAQENGDEDAAQAARIYEDILAAQPLAEQGDARAQAELAAFYMELSLSMQQDEDDEQTALKWAQLSAQQACADGMYILGMAYAQGRAVEQDAQIAFDWYEKGAALEHAPCMQAMAQMILQADIGDRSDEEAFALLLRAARAGYVPAMRDTARCYRFGEGVEESLGEALHWMEQALAVSDDPDLAEEARWLRALAGE